MRRIFLPHGVTPRSTAEDFSAIAAPCRNALPYRRRDVFFYLNISALTGTGRIIAMQQDGERTLVVSLIRCRTETITETEMSVRIIAAVGAVLVLASTGLASAQTRAYRYDPYARAYMDDAASYSWYHEQNPFAGTFSEGVPYGGMGPYYPGARYYAPGLGYDAHPFNEE